MKQHIQQLLKTALQALHDQGTIEHNPDEAIHLEHTRDKQHGDFASNIALSLAKQAKCKPRDLAEKIAANLPVSDLVLKTEIAGPGFINFFLVPHAWHSVVKTVLEQGSQYGHSKTGNNQRILVEFVSSNPTGPLHVGHGRGAAYGASLCNLLEAIGCDVYREYYVNDGGRQMDILATSVWLRYLEAYGEVLTFPSNGYKGLYVKDIARVVKETFGEEFRCSAADVFKDIPLDEPEGGDKETHIDALINKAKNLLGPKNYRIVFDAALKTILDDIRDDLVEFNVHYQNWFSERSLIEDGTLERTIDKLKYSNHTYERDGALWFNSTAFGDDKDRVLLRENGQPTYFAADAAYRLNIFERGFTHIINVLGSDHHGYVPRIRAVIQALDYDPSLLTVPMVQFAVLYRGKERAQMSTRSGEFVTLRELREEVGTDAARFFYVLRKAEQHMDFDLELAKSQSSDNPVYYVQYAHARICSVQRQLNEKNMQWDQTKGLEALALLTEPHEIALLGLLNRYPELLEQAALNYEPHTLAHFLRDLANGFHTYYNSHQFLVEDVQLRNARLALIFATKQVLANGLKLLGVSAPEMM